MPQRFEVGPGDEPEFIAPVGWLVYTRGPEITPEDFSRALREWEARYGRPDTDPEQ